MISGLIELIKYNNKEKWDQAHYSWLNDIKTKSVEWDQAQYNFQIE